MKQKPKWTVGCMNGKKVASSRQVAEYLQMQYEMFVVALSRAETEYYSYKKRCGKLDEMEEIYFELTTKGYPKDIWMTSNGLILGLVVLDKYPKLYDDPLSKLIGCLSQKSGVIEGLPQEDEVW